MNETHGMFEILATTVCGVILTLLLYVSRRVAGINDAVNQRHERQDGDGNVPEKMYDLVLGTHTRVADISIWKDTFHDGPFSTGAAAADFAKRTVNEMEKCKLAICDIQQKVDRIALQLSGLACVDDGTCPDENQGDCQNPH